MGCGIPSLTATCFVAGQDVGECRNGDGESRRSKQCDELSRASAVLAR